MGEQSERISTARLSQGFLYIQKHTLHSQDNNIFQNGETSDDLLPIS